MRSILRIDDLNFMLHLGVTPVELASPQRVSISIAFIFHEMIQGMQTDSIDDTLCYQKLEDILRTYLTKRHFHLLEHLGYVSFELIRAQLPQNVDFNLQVTKYLPKDRGSRSFILSSYEDHRWPL